MIRQSILLFLSAAVVAAGTMYVAYGEVDPCRALAVERARRVENSSGLPVSGIVEPFNRLETSQLSTSQCARELIRSWFDRLSREIH